MSGYQNVLIIKLRHLGDVLTTTPVLTGARSAWPEARISYLVNPGAEDLVRHHPEVSEVLTVPRRGGLVPQAAFVQNLRRRGFDLAIELSGGDRGAFLAWASGAGRRVGYAPAGKGRLSRRLFFTDLVTSVVDSKHTVEYHLDALRALGLDPGFQPLSLYWPGEASERAGTLLAEAGLSPDTPYAVVHPTSRWMFKTWRPEANARIIEHLDRSGLAVVVTSAPERVELDYVRRVLDSCDASVIDLSGRLGLCELAAVIGGARMFFGVDSLPMHMAAAVGTPAVALFGPSGEHMWAPWGPGHRVVSKDWDCRPCGRDGCDGSKVSRCLVELEPGEVLPAIEAVLEAAK
ncbi:MAG: putative lipopolysaccharide heptosyltransferase III [Proteobacteria bacterium]|nr:putative lipopolysaccharide heptosyltransferase III [Pseudomonadota bacterium]